METNIRDAKQDKLNEDVRDAITKAGGQNYIQASYMRELCKAVLRSESETLDALQPDVIDSKEETWVKALKLSMAFLRRYKMDLTIATMRYEYRGCPRFRDHVDVDKDFDSLIASTKCKKLSE